MIHTNLTRRFWSIIIIDHPQVIPFMRFCACPEILGCVDCARPGFHKKSKRQLDGILDGIQTARTSFSERPWVLSSFLYLFEVSKCVWCYVLSFSLFYLLKFSPLDSTVLAYVLKTLNNRYDYGLELILLSVDEGITGYRDDSLEVYIINVIYYTKQNFSCFYLMYIKYNYVIVQF